MRYMLMGLTEYITEAIKYYKIIHQGDQRYMVKASKTLGADYLF